MRMDKLFDNGKFKLYHFLSRDHEGFEIMDMRTRFEVYIDGPGVALIRDAIETWQSEIPHEREVEAFLSSLMELSLLPIVFH